MIVQIKLFEVVKEVHSCIYNLQRLQFDLVQQKSPSGLSLSLCEVVENSDLVKCLSKFFGCLNARTVFWFPKISFIRTLLESDRSLSHFLAIFWLSKLLKYVVTKGRVVFLEFGSGAGPCSLASLKSFQQSI